MEWNAHLRRPVPLVPSAVRSVRLRSTMLTGHPHLGLPLHAVVHSEPAAFITKAI